MNNPDPVLVQHYAVLKGISREEARNKLRENYELEVKEIPLRDLVLRTLTGMRAIAPKVEGMANREQGTIIRVRQLNSRVDNIERLLDSKIHSFERLLNDQPNYTSQIEELKKEIEYLKLPWYKKLFNAKRN